MLMTAGKHFCFKLKSQNLSDYKSQQQDAQMIKKFNLH